MNIILAEELRYPLNSFLESIRSQKKVPGSSLVFCNKNNLFDVKKIIASPPPLTRGWVIFVNNNKILEDDVRSLESDYNWVIYVVRNKDSLRELGVNFESWGVEFRLVNNLEPSEEKVISYIMTELGLSESDAKYLYNRHRGYLPRISESVDRLSVVENLDRKNIRKYTEAASDISIDVLFRYIIGQDDGKGMSTKAANLIFQFRYGLPYVMKQLLRKFEVYIFLYEDILSGQLSRENYKEYYKNNRDTLKDVSEYFVEKAILAVGTVSSEKLVYLYWLFKEKHNESYISPTMVLGLVRLAKMGG